MLLSIAQLNSPELELQTDAMIDSAKLQYTPTFYNYYGYYANQFTCRNGPDIWERIVHD